MIWSLDCQFKTSWAVSADDLFDFSPQASFDKAKQDFRGHGGRGILAVCVA